MHWRCPTHGRVEADESDPRCPRLLRRTIAGEAVAEPCGKPLDLVDDDDE
jgi:hypothetical protein